jgi:hypothetical protein
MRDTKEISAELSRLGEFLPVCREAAIRLDELSQGLSYERECSRVANALYFAAIAKG